MTETEFVKFFLEFIENLENWETGGNAVWFETLEKDWKVIMDNKEVYHDFLYQQDSPFCELEKRMIHYKYTTRGYVGWYNGQKIYYEERDLEF